MHDFHHECEAMPSAHLASRSRRITLSREEESPAANGKWRYAWETDLHKYVKPEYAAAVSAMLAKTDDSSVQEAPQMSDVVGNVTESSQ